MLLKFSLLLCTYGISIFASHPAYDFSNGLGIAPIGTHPAYSTNDDLGLIPNGTHPAYNNSDGLGLPNGTHPIHNNSDELGIIAPSRSAYNHDDGLGIPYIKVPNISIDNSAHRIQYPVDDGTHAPANVGRVIPVIPIDDQLGIVNPMPADHLVKANASSNFITTSVVSVAKGNGSLGARSIAASNVISSATESEESGSDMQFRFGLSTGQINLSRIKSINSTNDSTPYSKILGAIARTIDSTKAIRKDENNMTFWISGIYSQGETFSMFDNPSSTDKHHGLMFGTHYKHNPTQQIFGIAIDVGTSNSSVKTNRDQKTDTRMAQVTLYYNKMLTNNWKLSWHNSFMKGWDRHQRPFTDNNNNQQIAISNGTSIEFSSIAGIGYKYDFNRESYLEPFFNFNYTYNKQFAHQEKNVDRYNRLNSEVSADQIGLQFGLKTNFSKEISDTKTFLIIPKIAYTFYAKMSKIMQNSINVSSGETSMAQSGTPGRHLLTTMVALGVADQDTTTRLAYTSNFQRKRRSHEIMIDWSIKF